MLLLPTFLILTCLLSFFDGFIIADSVLFEKSIVLISFYNYCL